MPGTQLIKMLIDRSHAIIRIRSLITDANVLQYWQNRLHAIIAELFFFWNPNNIC